jgi:nucleoside-diphosphate-sugar epimerase
MKIVVTGGSGRLGGFAIRELLQCGHDVLSLDLVAPQTRLCPSWIVDLRRAGDLYQALKGADGVIHLGAYMAPGLAPDTETFSNNVDATYNVVKTAGDLDVRHVVLASSVAAYGFIYAARIWPPDYLPLDESHPCRPQDPYGLSKVVGEQIADSFASYLPLSIVSLRLPGINFDTSYATFAERWRTPTLRLGGFWTYIDARDAATACRLAVEASFDGHEVFNVAAPTTFMREPTAELLQRYVPGVKRIKKGLDGNWSPMDSSKAEQVLGFKPEHAWQTYVPSDAAGSLS